MLDMSQPVVDAELAIRRTPDGAVGTREDAPLMSEPAAAKEEGMGKDKEEVEMTTAKFFGTNEDEQRALESQFKRIDSRELNEMGTNRHEQQMLFSAFEPKKTDLLMEQVLVQTQFSTTREEQIDILNGIQGPLEPVLEIEDTVVGPARLADADAFHPQESQEAGVGSLDVSMSTPPVSPQFNPLSLDYVSETLDDQEETQSQMQMQQNHPLPLESKRRRTN